MTTKINATLPAATLAQRLASLSETQLMQAAEKLAKDRAQDQLCTAVLDELAKRVGGEDSEGFQQFVAEIYA